MKGNGGRGGDLHATLTDVYITAISLRITNKDPFQTTTRQPSISSLRVRAKCQFVWFLTKKWTESNLHRSVGVKQNVSWRKRKKRRKKKWTPRRGMLFRRVHAFLGARLGIPIASTLNPIRANWQWSSKRRPSKAKAGFRIEA